MKLYHGTQVQNIDQFHFPKAWNTASQMTNSEIEQMISEWKASLKTDK